MADVCLDAGDVFGPRVFALEKRYLAGKTGLTSYSLGRR